VGRICGKGRFQVWNERVDEGKLIIIRITDVRQLNLPHETKKTKMRKTDKSKNKIVYMLRSIGKQSRESVESVLKKKRKATVGKICRKGKF